MLAGDPWRGRGGASRPRTDRAGTLVRAARVDRNLDAQVAVQPLAADRQDMYSSQRDGQQADACKADMYITSGQEVHQQGSRLFVVSQILRNVVQFREHSMHNLVCFLELLMRDLRIFRQSKLFLIKIVQLEAEFVAGLKKWTKVALGTHSHKPGDIKEHAVKSKRSSTLCCTKKRAGIDPFGSPASPAFPCIPCICPKWINSSCHNTAPSQMHQRLG